MRNVSVLYRPPSTSHLTARLKFGSAKGGYGSSQRLSQRYASDSVGRLGSDGMAPLPAAGLQQYDLQVEVAVVVVRETVGLACHRAATAENGGWVKAKPYAASPRVVEGPPRAWQRLLVGSRRV